MIDKIKNACCTSKNFVYKQGYSIYELICKILEKIDELIDRLNEIDDEIENTSIYLNVKSPPKVTGVTKAKGDGLTDDTIAIQQAIDYVFSKNGGVIYLPTGIYIVDGLILKDNVMIEGENKLSTSIKKIDSSTTTTHIITVQDFDTLANNVDRAEPVGLKNGGIRNITIDGNKYNNSLEYNGLGYYGVNLYLHNIEIKNCTKWGLHIEAPGATFSNIVGQNLQYDIDGLEIHDNDFGNFYNNGQSDSVYKNVVCYETNGTNFLNGQKATGIKVYGLHCWGLSEYGLINEATTAGFNNTHIESASIVKVWFKATTYFDGRVYEAGSNTNVPAFLIGTSANNYIRATISNLKYGIEFETTDPASNMFDLQMFSTVTDAELFKTPPSRNNFIRANKTGGIAENIYQNYNCRFELDGNLDYYSDGQGFAYYTSKTFTDRQFGIEHTPGAINYFAVTGSNTTIGPNLIARGTDTDIDLRVTPKGDGKVRFGTHNTVGAETITGYIEIKDNTGVVRKIAIIS